MAHEARPAGGQLLTQLSNAMVALHREHFGRGPGAAKTVFADDMVVCILSDVYTQVETFVSAVGFDPDLAIELFLLEPLPASQDGAGPG